MGWYSLGKLATFGLIGWLLFATQCRGPVEDAHEQCRPTSRALSDTQLKTLRLYLLMNSQPQPLYLPEAPHHHDLWDAFNRP